MAKVFNVNGACRYARHYMVDLDSRLALVKRMIDGGEYFVISKARQYGKTTLLRALSEYLEEDYLVISLDFQNIESEEYTNGSTFVRALTREINKRIQKVTEISDDVKGRLHDLSNGTNYNVRMAEMFACFSEWCDNSEKPVVLIIDEIDTAANNQVFLDFLAQLRAAYLDSDKTATFQSVILAGVYDIRNIRRKIRPEDEHKQNSPWNIASDFDVDMSFSSDDIAGMLYTYEADYNTGMDIRKIADIIYDYTSGYPFLVSRICKLIDERVGSRDYNKADAWTEEGLQEALKILLTERNTLFESLIAKLTEYPKLRELLYTLLFHRSVISYNPLNRSIEVAEMFGFVVNCSGNAAVSNRIFETILYNWFLSDVYCHVPGW